VTTLFTDIHKLFLSWPNAGLSFLLLGLAAALAILAFIPDHEVVKALILAWVIFP
jgi:hypothetical protein